MSRLTNHVVFPVAFTAALAACGAAPDADGGSPVTGVTSEELTVAVPADDKSLTAQVGAWFFTGVTEGEVIALCTEHHARLTNLEVDPTDPTKFTVTLVKNAGAYAVSGWWWYHGITAADLSRHLDEHDARLIDLQTYATPQGPRFAAVMVSNAGAAHRASWWYADATIDQVKTALETNGARLTSLQSREVDGKILYTAISIENAGQDATGWWWSVNATADDVGKQLQAHGARLIDLYVRPNGRLDVVMVRSKGEFSGWYVGLGDPSDITFWMEQTAQRAIRVRKYMSGGAARYAAVLIDNADAATRRFERAIAPGVPFGNASNNDGSTRAAFGAFVKEIGGPVSLSLGSNHSFNPFFTMVPAIHLYALVKDGSRFDQPIEFWDNISLDRVGGYSGYDWPSYLEEWKDKFGPPVMPYDEYVSIGDADTRMLAYDLGSTYAVQIRYGNTALNAFLQNTMGMSHSKFDGFIDTPFYVHPGDYNSLTTAADLAHFYEMAASSSTLPAATRDAFAASLVSSEVGFYERPQPSADGNDYHLAFADMVRQEAGALGKTAATVESFVSNTFSYGKQGHGSEYQLPFDPNVDPEAELGTYVQAGAGVVLLPVVGAPSNPAVSIPPDARDSRYAHRAYAYSHYIVGSQLECPGYYPPDLATCPQYLAARKASGSIFAEELRTAVRQALETWP
jgi:hypothetical protein